MKILANLQQIQKCLARTVVKAPKSSHITPIHRSLHWLKINERIEYKLLSLTYTIRYDTIGEFNVDSKVEYSALSSTRSQKKKLKQPTPVPL